MTEFSDIVAIINARAAPYAGSPWTEELKARVRGMVAQGMSRADIARTIGMSRNAVTGACARMGLSSPPRVVSPDKRRARRRLEAKARRERRKVAGPRPTPEVFPKGAVNFTQLRECACHWPLWNGHEAFYDKLYCGQIVVPEKPYCAVHFKLARQPSRYQP